MRFLLILLCFSVHPCFAQEQDTLRKYLDGDFRFTSRSRKVYHAKAYAQDGYWMLTASNTNNNTVLTARFSDKKLTQKHGIFVVHYSDGKKAIEGYYNNNQRTGIWKSWYASGMLKDSGVIENSTMTGTWQSWYENGLVKARGEYKGDTAITENMISSVNTSGSLLDMQAPAAIKHGPFQTWHINGGQKDSGNFVNNQRIGLWKSWYENGRLAAAGYYKNNDTLQGEWTFYREDGSMSTREVYVNNKLSALRCFDEKGNDIGSMCSIAKPPVLLGTRHDWKTFLETNLYWSKATLRTADPGLVKLRLIIGKDGKLVKYVITHSPHDLVTKDVSRVLDLMTDWSPAILHNRPIEYSLEHLLRFYP